MSLFPWGHTQASMVWLEPYRIQAGSQLRAMHALPEADQLAQALSTLPQGPTTWVVDDLWMPSLLLRDFVERPAGAEAQDAFFRWRYAQHLALGEPQAVQALDLGEAAWLLVGMPQSVREEWLQVATQLGRPIRSLVPRWLWIYNRLAPTREVPGMLLSLVADGAGHYTGTLVAWGRNLTLLRQWNEPALPETWAEERVLPSATFLQRDHPSPQELLVWGASGWPETLLPTRILPREIPPQETL